MEFWTYYRVFRRRRWLIVGAMLIAVVVAVGITRPEVRDYQAAATLSVPSEQRALFIFGAPDQAGPDARLGQALSLLRSHDLAGRVVQRLNLSMSPDDLQRRLAVSRDPGSGLIRLTATAGTPAEAMTLANAVADTAAAYDQEMQVRDSALAREFVEKQVDASSTALRKAEDALLRFQQEHEVLLASATSREVANLRTEGVQAGLSLNEVGAKLSSIRAQMDQQSPTRSDQEITDNPVAQQLRAQLVELEVALTSELATHTDQYPSVIALKAKIQAVKDRLSTELGRIISSERVQHNPVYDALSQNRINLETERVALLAEQEALGRALSTARQQLPGLSQAEMEQSRLQRNVDFLSKEYSDLQARLAQTRLREQETQDLGGLTVVGHAREAQPSPLQGKLARLLLAAVLGLLGGVGLAYFLDYLDNGVNTPENAERLLGMPVLAAIPRHNPPFEEAYRALQVSLAVRKRGGKADAIAVTGLRPGSGTSTVVANLARAFADAGWRTLVVDGAFQRPSQHLLFGVPNEKGLAELLGEEAAIQETLVETAVPNLRLLPGGTASERVRGRLGSLAMGRLLAELKQRVDVILVDTPPIGAFADALSAARLVSGLLLVLDARQAPRGIEERVKAQLDRVGAKIRGSVLTKVRPDLVDSYVYQERYYHVEGRRLLSPAAAAVLGLSLVAAFLATIAWLSVRASEWPVSTAAAQAAAQWAPRLSQTMIAWLSAHAGQGRDWATAAAHAWAQWVSVHSRMAVAWLTVQAGQRHEWASLAQTAARWIVSLPQL